MTESLGPRLTATILARILEAGWLVRLAAGLTASHIVAKRRGSHKWFYATARKVSNAGSRRSALTGLIHPAGDLTLPPEARFCQALARDAPVLEDAAKNFNKVPERL